MMSSTTTTNNDPLREQSPPSYESIVPNRSEGWPSEPLRGVEEAKPGDESRFITVPQATHAMRQELYITLVKAASNCRASLNDMEDLMLAGARILDTEITLLRVRGTITCLVGSRTAGWELKIKYRHSARVGAHSEDGLHTVHDTLNAVAAEDMTIAEAIDGLNGVIEEQELDFPIRSPIIHLCVAAAMSIATYAILSRGSFRGADIPALGALLMSIAHIILYFHNPSNARILELLSTILTSLIVHDSRVSAVATTTLASALSGYLYMCNIVKHHSDSLTVTLAKIAFWSTYSILLGFGLPILLDLALMHKLLQLVVRVHDMFAKKGSRRLDTSNKVGRPVVEKSGALHV